MPETEYSDLTIYRRALLEARPYWLKIIGTLLLSLLSTPIALLTPLPLKIAVDSVVNSHPAPDFVYRLMPDAARDSSIGVLLFSCCMLIAIAILKQIQGQANSLLRSYTGEKLLLGFRARLFRQAQQLSLSYHDSKGTADSIYRIQSDAPAIKDIAMGGIIPFITALVTFLSMLLVALRLDWQLTSIGLVIAPLLLVVSRKYRRPLRKKSRELKKLQSLNLAVVQETLTAVRVVKAFGKEESEERRFVTNANEGIRARVRLGIIEGSLGLLLNFITTFGMAAVLFVGIRHVQSGIITLGDFLLLMSYISQLYSPLKTISTKVTSMQSTLASAERAFTLLDEMPEVLERPNARSLAHARGAVTFKNVSFAYEEGRPALDNVSFEIATGTRVGIAGKTGAGKTTIVSLLTRLYDPSAGQILLDGVDLRDYKLADLRNQFAIVLQDTVLFSSSIAENIAYARPDASLIDIIAAAKAANAHEFIINLPKGYETLVGERGMRVSGGERQRIGLARAFLKNAPILILDEPTSSVDLQTEALIMETMERLMHGRTAFMIAHRLSTLTNCDMILKLDGGRLIETAIKQSSEKLQG